MSVLSNRAGARANAEGAFVQLTADFLGVAPQKLRDRSLIAGLVVAAASAAGLSPAGAPVVREMPDGVVAGLLMLDGCHIVAHGFPDRELVLLDLLGTAQHDVGKALDVFVRRLGAREVRSDTRARG